MKFHFEIENEHLTTVLVTVLCAGAHAGRRGRSGQSQRRKLSRRCE